MDAGTSLQSLSEQEEFERLLVLEEADALSANLADFAKAAWPLVEPTKQFDYNWHLDVVFAYLEHWYRGTLRGGTVKNLIFNLSPGGMKSLSTSVFGPAWWWANDPSARFINLTNADTLAERDSVKMRSIILSNWYQERWGHKVTLTKEQSGKMYFTNTKSGFRQALGFNANISGKRGTHLLIDDAIDAKKAFSDADINSVNLTFDQAVGNRLDDVRKSGICIMMQRVRINDLTGHVLEKEPENWVLVKIPMRWTGVEGYDPVKDLGPEYAHLRDPRRKGGTKLYFPLRFPEKEVKVAEKRLGEYGTAGQHQQDPVPLGGGILKKKWWVRWEDMHGWQKRNKDRPRRPPPLMKHVFWSWDTAYTTRDRKENAFSAGTKWGLFYDEGDMKDKLMLIDAWHDRVAFYELKKKILHASIQDTDAHLIERKASGISVIQELRRNRRIKVRSYDPRRDGDKESRAMLCTSHFESGMIVYPDRDWAKELIDLVSTFPTGAPPSSDYTDTVSQAVLYVVRRQWIRHPDDEVPDEPEVVDEDDDDDYPVLRHGTYG